jgi:ATP-binding cassette subfamily B protein/subfamily B ATP-binding cassette protein MsbA
VNNASSSKTRSAWQLCLRLLPYAVRRWRELLTVLATMLAKVGLDVLKPLPMLFLLDYVLGGKQMGPALANALGHLPWTVTRDGLLGWGVAATVVIFLLAWSLGLASAFANISFGQRMIYDLAADLFSHLQRLSLRFHARKGVGDNIRRVTTDCGCISTIIKDALLPVIASLVALASMFGVMWKFDPVLTLLSLAVVPLMVIVFRLYAQPMMDRSYAQNEIEGRNYSLVEENLSAIAVVQAFGREEANDAQFRRANSAALQATLAATQVQLQFKVLMGAATALGTACILWFGAQHALAGHLSLGKIVLFLSYLGSLYGPLEALMYTTSTINSAAGSARRVAEVFDTDREVDDKLNAAPLPAARGEVRIENVTFGYEPDRPVLREVSLEVKPGEVIAIVGPTGAGKSTLVSLLPRFFDPWQGRVLLDGRDVRDVRLKSLRDQVALVLQEPFLFPLSVAENVAYGHPHATLAQIETAARTANAHEFITRLPQGYETVIGERGATLSGGERQRLSIARALLKDAPILILDEPTSALDAQTEASLLEALERLMKGRTTFIIAHRLSTIRRASRILVLEDGRVVETGTHDELLALGKTYAKLHRLQFGATAGTKVISHA